MNDKIAKMDAETEALILKMRELIDGIDPLIVGAALVHLTADNLLTFTETVGGIDARNKIMDHGIDCISEDTKDLVRRMTGSFHASDTIQ